jgi:hypothetical protein
MRDAARALDDVSDHLGEVLRRADQLLAEWSGFGDKVRAEVEREVAGIGMAVDGAVTRAAGAGLDRAIADRLRALTVELERLEQRSRAAARAVAEHREADRRVLWIVVAGMVLANALLVVLLLRRPEPAPAAEPVRIESTVAPQPAPEPANIAPPIGSSEPGAGTTGSASEAPGAAAAAGSNAASAGAPGGPSAGAGSGTSGTRAGSNTPSGATPKGALPPGGKPAEAGVQRPTASPIALPPKGGTSRPHKKLP